MLEELNEQIAKGSPSKMSYDEIMRRGYGETQVKCQGNIVQLIKRSDDNCVIIVGLENNNNKILWIEHNRSNKNMTLPFYDKGGEQMLEGDKIAVWGDMKGIQAYKGLLGNDIKAMKIISNWTELIKKSEEIDTETKEISYLKSIDDLLQKIYVSTRGYDLVKGHKFGTIEEYEDLKQILTEMGFKIIDEKYRKERFESSKWISTNGVLEIENVDINKSDQGVTLKFFDKTEVRCKTTKLEKFF